MLRRLTDYDGHPVLIKPAAVVVISCDGDSGHSAIQVHGDSGASIVVRGEPDEVARKLGLLEGEVELDEAAGDNPRPARKRECELCGTELDCDGR